LTGAVSQPSWKSKPSVYVVATDDRMIPPPAQRAMAARAGSRVTEVAGSHAVYVSQPAAIAAAIDLASQAASV
jgi:pimeloyl-ACP methyl ester carboxylesterase